MHCCGLSSTGLSYIDISDITDDILLAIDDINFTDANNNIINIIITSGTPINIIYGICMVYTIHIPCILHNQVYVWYIPYIYIVY